MTSTIQNIMRKIDAVIARGYLSLFPERNALLCFTFHSLFRHENDIQKNLVDPIQRTTVDQFRQFVEYYLYNEYQFIGPDAVAHGLKADGKYAVITFDDGYYNNTLALPILEEYNIPATFFIASNNVRDNRCFWWDVLYRELSAAVVPREAIQREGLMQKHLRTAEIDARLSARFGPRAFIPRSDIDRPFSPSELRDFASNRHVRIGNHTAGHAILTNYALEEISAQIQSAQESLREMTGTSPIAIAYPNGEYNDEIIQTSRELGLKIGFTTRQRKITLPIEPSKMNLMTLGRFCLHGGSPILTQCRTCRSDFLHIYPVFRDCYVSLRRQKLWPKKKEKDGIAAAMPSFDESNLRVSSSVTNH